MMDHLDRKILTLIQEDFPINRRPYLSIAKKLRTSEKDVLLRLNKMGELGLIRRIGAVFDSKSLGYTSTLCTMKVPDFKLHNIAEIINTYEGVTHNYIREHEYNLWFTLISSSPQMLDNIIKEIKDKTGLMVFTLPALKIFKIRVKFSLL